MEKEDEKIIAPEKTEEELKTKNASEEIKEETSIEGQEPEEEDRLTAVETEVQTLNEKFNEVVTEQEKIVTVLEQISEKVLQDEEAAEEVAEEQIAEEEPATNAMEVGDVDNSGAEKEDTPTVEEPTTETPAEEEPTVTEVEAKPEEQPTDEATTEETKEEPEEEEKVEEDSTEDKEEQPEEEIAPEKVEAEEIDDNNNNKKEEDMTKEELQEILNAFKADVKNEILDAKVEAPEIKEADGEAEEKPAEKPAEVAENWRQRYNDQVAAAWDFHRLNNIEAGKKLQAINQYNADVRVKNDAGSGPITITSLADFVLPPEMDKEIHGYRSNYTPFLANVRYAQTDRLQFAYTTRVGDINMQNVKFCNDGADGNLKPVETYGLERAIAQMEEMAAVTPICDNATKYMAVDILADVAEGYRNDYDRKLAQLAIVRMQQALNLTGQTIEYDPATAVDGLVDFVKATTLVSEDVVNGKFVFNARTKAVLLEFLLRSANDGLGERAFTTGDTQTIWGYEYIVVPNDLMPTLGTNEVKQFKALNNATGVLETVNITTPVFYGDLNAYRGYVNGGLKYTVSTDAPYEIGGTIYSAYQRNELVLRGSFYRGGYIAEIKRFAGLAPTSS